MTPPSQPPADSPLRASGLSDETPRYGMTANADDVAWIEEQVGTSSYGWDLISTESIITAAWKRLEFLATHPPVPLPEGAGEPTDGVSLIRAERQRQIRAEGWTPEHDDNDAPCFGGRAPNQAPGGKYCMCGGFKTNEVDDL